MQFIYNNPFVFFTVVTSSLFAGIAAILALGKRRQGRKLPATLAGIVYLVEDGAIIDETPAGRLAIEQSDRSNWDWSTIVESFAPRFQRLPATFDAAFAQAPLQLISDIPGDASRLELTSFGSRLRLELLQSETDNAVAMHHLALLDQLTLSSMTRAISAAPYPIWVCDAQGRESWRSPEYLRLRSIYLTEKDDSDPLFRVDVVELREQGCKRAMLPDDSEMGEKWFEIRMSEDGGVQTFFAVNITPLVRAERAQRGFVQTLTKTFAQLGTGLAIFDRDRQLVLFNPALIDLTDMSAEFLSSRPTLTSFFDWLRENRVMPEPRDYSQWRNKLQDLTKAATEGTFSELWSLPNGLSYRVFGRPHPDGAIAFLFEDVTAELSLTRNFVTELEINHSLLDSLPQAIAIFSPSGDILSVNRAYQDIWGNDPNTQVQPVSIPSTVAFWQDSCAPFDKWDTIRRTLTRPTLSKGTQGRLTTLNGEQLAYRIAPLSKGASAIVFEQLETAPPRQHEVEVLA